VFLNDAAKLHEKSAISKRMSEKFVSLPPRADFICAMFSFARGNS
jgi:hypothetical protein